MITEPTLLPSDNPRVPAATQPFRHRMRMQMRFTDIDMLGHLNNNIYMSFMDLAKIRYFEDLGGRPVDMHDFDLVVVHIDIDFYEPTFLGDKPEVWTTVTRIGNRSLSLEQRLVDACTGHTKCIAATIMSGFNPATQKSQPISIEWIQAIERFEERPFRD